MTYNFFSTSEKNHKELKKKIGFHRRTGLPFALSFMAPDEAWKSHGDVRSLAFNSRVAVREISFKN